MAGLATASVFGSQAGAFESAALRRTKWRSMTGDKNDWFFDDPFERSKPGTERLPYTQWQLKENRSEVGQILDLIAFAEAGKQQYNAVHYSARRRPPRKPTQMTLGQIFAWIKATPGQHHAIGRYQFIPSTLVALVRRAGLSHSTRFSPKVQDQLAFLLLQDAGYDKVRAGKITKTRFMHNLARIWAGLPTKSGKSYYSGYAGNRATVSRKFYASQINKILG